MKKVAISFEFARVEHMQANDKIFTVSEIPNFTWAKTDLLTGLIHNHNFLVLKAVDVDLSQFDGEHIAKKLAESVMELIVSSGDNDGYKFVFEKPAEAPEAPKVPGPRAWQQPNMHDGQGFRRQPLPMNPGPRASAGSQYPQNVYHNPRWGVRDGYTPIIDEARNLEQALTSIVMPEYSESGIRVITTDTGDMRRQVEVDLGNGTKFYATEITDKNKAPLVCNTITLFEKMFSFHFSSISGIGGMEHTWLQKIEKNSFENSLMAKLRETFPWVAFGDDAGKMDLAKVRHDVENAMSV